MTDRDALRRGIREALDRAELPVFDPATGEGATGRVRPGAVRVWRAGDAVASATAGAPPPEGKPAGPDDAINLYDFSVNADRDGGNFDVEHDGCDQGSASFTGTSVGDLVHWCRRHAQVHHVAPPAAGGGRG